MVAFAQASQLKPYECQKMRTYSKIKSLSINNADKYPIKLERGTNATINIKFVSKKRFRQCALKIVGEISGQKVPFSATNDINHCKNAIKQTQKSKRFSLRRKRVYDYTFQFPVKEQYPSLKLLVHYQLMARSRCIVCL